MADHATSHSTAVIQAAISVFEEVLRLQPIGNEQRADTLDGLGNALFFFCFYHEANRSRRDRCFELLREALELCPPGHSSRDRALHNFARALAFVEYEQESDGLTNLKESMLLNREALQLRPEGHPERHKSLDSLAYGLMRSFHHSGDLDLLAEVIKMLREALELTPLGHPDREKKLLNLASSLNTSFQHQGRPETLAEEISIGREALHLHPVGHPLRWMSLTTLGNALGLSFELKGLPDLLSESIRLHREAVQLVPSTHPDQGGVLGNLARYLVASFRQCHDQSALSEAITLLRQSLHLPAGLGGDRRLEILGELANALIASADEDQCLDHLHEAVNIHREVLGSRPPGHYRRMESLQNLGRLLCRPECHSWSEALALHREALDICPAGSPVRAELLCDTSRCFLDPGSPFFDLSQGVAHLSQAYSDSFCHVNRRLRLAISGVQSVETAYVKATESFDEARVESNSSCVLGLYAQVIGLIPRAANFGLDHKTRLQAVAGLDGIARDTAARAVLLGHEAQAVEMLEEGRGVFWAQALHLRTSAFDGVPQEERHELERLFHHLDDSARRVERVDLSATLREQELETRRQLNEEAEGLIIKIRGYAGLDRFLLPPAFSNLVDALPDGYVIIVNASKLGHRALLLRRDIGIASSLQLQPPPTGFDSESLRLCLPRDVVSSTREGETRAMRKDSGRGGTFLDILAVLWTTVVRPIVTQLGLQV
jgi:tetratricopeptide (TPR) repeat protein